MYKSLDFNVWNTEFLFQILLLRPYYIPEPPFPSFPFTPKYEPATGSHVTPHPPKPGVYLPPFLHLIWIKYESNSYFIIISKSYNWPSAVLKILLSKMSRHYEYLVSNYFNFQKWHKIRGTEFFFLSFNYQFHFFDLTC